MMIEPFVTLDSKRIGKETIIFNHKVQEWCALPYPGYPGGCINVGKCDKTYRADILDKYDRFVLAWATFDLAAYKLALRGSDEKFRYWSDKQLGNSRLWQSQLRRLLKECVRDVLHE